MDFSLTQIKGIGLARLKAFEAAGIRTVRELVMCLPREYRDFTQITPLASLAATKRGVPVGPVTSSAAQRALSTASSVASAAARKARSI